MMTTDKQRRYQSVHHSNQIAFTRQISTTVMTFCPAQHAFFIIRKRFFFKGVEIIMRYTPPTVFFLKNEIV